MNCAHSAQCAPWIVLTVLLEISAIGIGAYCALQTGAETFLIKTANFKRYWYSFKKFTYKTLRLNVNFNRLKIPRHAETYNYRNKLSLNLFS
jgi:hypothetical protein